MPFCLDTTKPSMSETDRDRGGEREVSICLLQFSGEEKGERLLGTLVFCVLAILTGLWFWQTSKLVWFPHCLLFSAESTVERSWVWTQLLCIPTGYTKVSVCHHIYFCYFYKELHPLVSSPRGEEIHSCDLLNVEREHLLSVPPPPPPISLHWFILCLSTECPLCAMHHFRSGVTTMNMSENFRSKQMQTVITRRERGLCHGDCVMMGDSSVWRNEGSTCQGGALVQSTVTGHHWLPGCVKQQRVPRLWRLGSLW